MPDVYATIAEADAVLLERLAEVIELRGQEPAQRAMLDSYLAEIPFPEGARVLDIGCGTGVQSRVLAGVRGVREVVGVDASEAFLDHARRLSDGMASVSFTTADARNLHFADAEFDVAVAHTVLTHVPGAEQIIAEAFRVLRPGGWFAAFDGDYATTTVGLDDDDPLQACVDHAMANLVNDRRLVRRLARITADAGFSIESFRGHSYIQTSPADYMLTLVDRGADLLAAAGAISTDLAAGLKAEGKRRVANGTFFGFIGYASLIARKPA